MLLTIHPPLALLKKKKKPIRPLGSRLQHITAILACCIVYESFKHQKAFSLVSLKMCWNSKRCTSSCVV